MTNPNIRTHIATTIDQLLDGQIPGPLTVVRLAEAAGVKRWVLTHQHPDLMRDFQHRAAHINRDNPEVIKLRQRITELDTHNKQLRARNRELTDLVDRYAQVINELARRLNLPASQAADVIPFPDRT